VEEDIRRLEEEIRQLIEKYNKEEPKKPDADLLILAESPFTYSVELHLGNITMAVLEGGWGTGKTSSALLLFHKLKRRAPHPHVSYISCREATKIVDPEVRVKVNGTSSPSYLATLTVLSLIRPLSLANRLNKLSGSEYVFMTTFEKDLELNLDIDIMNEDVLTLIEKIAGYYANKGMKHVLLLDEFERCLVSQEDVILLGKLPETLRGLSDRHGSSPIVMILFAIDLIPADTPIVQYVGRSIGTYITSTIRRNLGLGAGYILDKMIVDKAKLTMSLLYGIVKKSVMVVAKRYNVEPDLLEPEDVKSVLEELTSITYHIRFSSDLLILSLASSFAKALREKSRQSLLEHFDNVISRIVSGISPDVVRRALVRGDFTIIEDIVGRDVVLHNLSRYIGEVMKEVGREMGARPLLVGERKDRGFLSLTYNVALTISSKKGGTEVVEKPLVFWLRYTNITEETVRKANKVFYRSNVVILSAEKIRHHPGLTSPTLPREFNIIDIAYMPHDVLFFLIVGSDRINDLKLRGALETKTYEILRNVVSGALDSLKQR
jgi:hypothetical protein